jgi:hypothetical protein
LLLRARISYYEHFGRVGRIVKMIAEYLEHALQFERMAKDETDAALRDSLLKQAQAYRKLATERAERLGLPRPPKSD